MSAGSAAGPARLRVPVSVRPARWGDVRPLASLYLSQSPAQRHGYHPFPFNRAAVTLIYFGLVSGQALFGWAMRRSPRLLALLFVAQVDATGEIAGSGTLRGVVRPGGERFVRFGFFVAEPFQGKGVGKRLLWGLASAGIERGYHRGLGAVFQSDAKAIPAIAGAGFKLTPTDHRDPDAPDEANFLAEADLDEMVRRSRERDGGAA